MVYITVKQSPAYRQMSLEEFLFQSHTEDVVINSNETNTRTYLVDSVSNRFASKYDFDELIRTLALFNESTGALREIDRNECYHTFHIPKKSGGLRRIDAPKPELMDALRRLKTIFEEQFHALYHSSAFAYIKQRSTIKAVRRHQQNESRWFGKYDLHNFFGSTTLDFVMQQLEMIFPFSEIIKIDTGREELRKALDLAFLNGALPQGTPISPLITNLIMIPVDYKLSNTLRNFEKQRFVYTRYADDFIVSSKHSFDFKRIEDEIKSVLAQFTAPFTINSQKTRYGSSAGRNWNLGVMLNKDNQITVGHKKKRQLQSMLHNYVLSRQNGSAWSRQDVQVMYGYYNYYRMVEKNAIDGIVKHMSSKMGVNILKMIKNDLK